MWSKIKAFFVKLWRTGFIKFAGSSFLCWSTDQLLAALLGDWLLPALGVTEAALIANISGYSARVISASMNFLINRRLVFSHRKNFAWTAVKYALLAVTIVTLSNLGVTGLMGLGVPRWIAKIGCDFVLYFLNFTGQRLFVFRDQKLPGKKNDQ